MNFTIYTSLTDYCEESYIIEKSDYQETFKHVVFLWCDDCSIKHMFVAEESFKNPEDLWFYIANTEDLL